MIQSIPLKKLVPSPLNVRKASDVLADLQLRADIAARGLLQNLVVRKGKRGKFEVEAGGRRLAALQALAGEGTLPENHEVNRLELNAGDHVIDLCAGTGANLAFLLERVGPSGKVTLVDLSQGMLDQARRRAKRLRASNVEFVQSDVAAFRFPSETSAVISTFGLEMPPDYAGIIERASAALPTGGRMALLGLKHPERWPRWLIEIGIFATKPFGVSRDTKNSARGYQPAES